MSYFLAPSLAALRAQANARWPRRDNTSDGWIGDASHAARRSDHNPDWTAPGSRRGIVRAYDLDEDLDGTPADNGAELGWWVDHLVATRDPRVAYIIYEARICSSTVAPWTWRTYTGPNAHRRHVHVSIRHTVAAENDTSPWFSPAAPAVPPAPASGGNTMAIINFSSRGRPTRTVIDGVVHGWPSGAVDGVHDGTRFITAAKQAGHDVIEVELSAAGHEAFTRSFTQGGDADRVLAALAKLSDQLRTTELRVAAIQGKVDPQ